MSPRIRGLRTFRAWLQARPQAADALLAAGLLLVGLPQMYLQDFPDGGDYAAFRTPDAVDGLIVVVVTMALTWRRRHPLPVLLVVVAGELTLTVWGYPPSVPDVMSFLIAVYSLAAHRGLAQSALGRYSAPIFLLGICGAALFYGDSLITPALSVMSAIEGFKDAPHVGHRLDHLVTPVSTVILIVLFLVQSKGTDKVARFFGPITLLWFLVIGGEISNITRKPLALPTLRFAVRDARGAEWAGDGTVTLTAHADHLECRIDASEPGQLEALKGALARHLDRFAFREAPVAFDWHDA